MKKILLMLSLLAAIPAVEAHATAEYIPGAKHVRIVVKLKAPTTSLLTTASFHAQTSSDLSLLKSISSTLGTSVRPMFGGASSASQLSAQSLAHRLGSSKSVLDRYLEIPLPAGLSEQEIRTAVSDIKSRGAYAVVYAQPEFITADIDKKITPLAVSSGETPLFFRPQDYKYESPMGIDSWYSAGFSGGDGEGVNIIDVEHAWNRQHEDLPAMSFVKGEQLPSSDARFELAEHHGTAVHGVIAAVINDYGVSGIAPKANFGYSSAAGTASSPAAAIALAAKSVGVGGIVLVELQGKGPARQGGCISGNTTCDFLPMEYWQAEYDAIKEATKAGVIVVEVAGNGEVDFDKKIKVGDVYEKMYGTIFDRTVRDSGAILVAASDAYERKPIWFTNYGGRIDIHGWGEKVGTTGYGDLYNGGHNRLYTQTFNGTSSAGAIVAGAVASLQGIAKKKLGKPLTPLEMRALISTTSTLQTAELWKRIGGLPNLKAAIRSLLGTALDANLISHSEGQLIIINETQHSILQVITKYDIQVAEVSLNVNGVAFKGQLLADGQYRFSWVPRGGGEHVVKATVTNNWGERKDIIVKLRAVTSEQYFAAWFSPINSLLLK